MKNGWRYRVTEILPVMKSLKSDEMSKEVRKLRAQKPLPLIYSIHGSNGWWLRLLRLFLVLSCLGVCYVFGRFVGLW